MSEETWARLDVARGHEPRASFVKRALEKALGDDQSGGPASAGVGSRGRAPAPASPRASGDFFAVAALERQTRLNRARRS